MEEAPPAEGSRRMHVVFLNWRDTSNPEGGGSERYVESVAQALVEAGHRATVLCAAHNGAPDVETREGVLFLRRGSKLGVYPAAALRLLLRRVDPYDVVVDVQNGVPFLSRLVTRRPVVVLVHHVHREQWAVVYGPRVARVGWWVESWLAPRVYRRCQYVAVSGVTRQQLGEIGVDPSRVAVVHNGTDHEPMATEGAEAPTPTLCVLGRLVPHKRVEHAIATVAALLPTYPDLRLRVIGDGWWADRLRAEADRLGVADAVDFMGFVEEETKHRALRESWVLVMPSLKEGWGLSIMEAAAHDVPAVAYGSAGGVAESIVDGTTGLLVGDDLGDFVSAVDRLLADQALRRGLGAAAGARARDYDWGRTARSFSTVLHDAVAGLPPRGDTDPGSATQVDLGVDLVSVDPVSLDGR